MMVRIHLEMIVRHANFRTSSTFLSAEGGPGLPKEHSPPHKNPNPFNPTTTIRYGIPHRAHVLLTVYNTLGQKVAELVNGDIEAGNHEIRFDGSNLASGIYFYRLQAGSFVQTRKLLLVK